MGKSPVAGTPNDRTLYCPHCSGHDVVCLAFMRRYHHADEWFRCDSCGHIFCGAKQNVWRSTQPTAHGRGSAFGPEVP
jgi:hypothetical protein